MLELAHVSSYSFGVIGTVCQALFDNAIYCSYSKVRESNSIQPKTPGIKQSTVSLLHWRANSIGWLRWSGLTIDSSTQS